jgi:tol-pal system protein YbgF
MRQARLMRYVLAGALLVLTPACATYFPSLGRTSMPPVPQSPPGTVPPGQARIADLNQQVQNLETRVAQLESQVAKLGGRPAAPPPAKRKYIPAPSTTEYPKPPVKPAVAAGQAEKYYTQGMSLYRDKKFREARKSFYRYLKNQPRGRKAPEARYYLADSFYQEKKFREAAVEFNKLRVQFPQSILAPAGLLRQALCYKNQRQNHTYRSTLRKLVKAYPNSPEAQEARRMLREPSVKPTGKVSDAGDSSTGRGTTHLATHKSR